MIRTWRSGISLLELLAVISIIGVVAATVIPRLAPSGLIAKSNACAVQREIIQIQAVLWRRENGRWPAANLADVGSNANFFPEGLPACPVDGSAYTLNTATGLVVGHQH